MRLLVVRHGLAGERADWAATGRPDEERPLTAHGRSRMKRNAAGIARLVPGLDVIATSPLVRAAETAGLLAKHAFPGTAIVTVAALASGGPRRDVVAWLSTRAADERVAIVGHEPDLGELVAFLLTGRARPAVAMRKGGACLLEIAGRPGPGAATLRWFLPPSLLRTVIDR